MPFSPDLCLATDSSEVTLFFLTFLYFLVLATGVVVEAVGVEVVAPPPVVVCKVGPFRGNESLGFARSAVLRGMS